MATTKGNKDQMKPLALDHSSSSIDDEESTTQNKHHQAKAQRWCIISCSIITVIISTTILIISLTVFKIKDPTLAMNSLTLNTITANLITMNGPLSLNATLSADMSVRNPNLASFQLNNSTTDIYYQGGTIGVAYAPSGNVRARRTARMVVNVDVMASRIALNVNVMDLLVGGDVVVNLTSFSRLSGRVNLLGVYKKHFDLAMNCSMGLVVSPVNQGIRYTDCLAKVEK